MAASRASRSSPAPGPPSSSSPDSSSPTSGAPSAWEGHGAVGLIELTPTWTTRPPRRGEPSACIEHRFVSEDEFDRLEDCGAFLGTVRLFGLPYLYGLPPLHPGVGRVSAVMLRAALVPRLRDLFADLTVYQIEDDRDRVAERLRQRSREGAELGSRLAGYEAEVLLGPVIAHRVFVNGDGPAVLADVLARAIGLDFAASRLPVLSA